MPVYTGTNPNTPIVGRLKYGGWNNWFMKQFCDAGTVTAKLGSYRNRWWAYTEADDGQWGYVPEVYFSGGANYERDHGLKIGSWDHSSPTCK